MSKVAITGNASGTGTLTIAAPNTNSDFTLSLPATTAPILAGSGITLSASAPANTLVTTSGGNVGIGTSSPATKLDVSGPASVTSFTGTTKLGFTTRGSTGATDYSGIDFTGNNQANPVARIAVLSGSVGSFLQFGTSNSYGSGITNTAMTLDPSGNLMVGVTSPVSVGAGAHVLSLKSSGTASSWGVGPTGTFGSFYVKNGASTGVVLTAAATSWASDSDERKKTTLTPFANAAEKVCSLRAGTGRYLTDEENMSRAFLIAQDVQAVLPEAVDVGEDEDRSLMLRYTDLIPLLTAAIQELKAKVDAQAAEIAALKGQP